MVTESIGTIHSVLKLYDMIPTLIEWVRLRKRRYENNNSS